MTRIEEIFSRLRLYDSRTCIEDGTRAYTYADLLHEVRRWQSRFDEWKVLAGMVVGIRADYSIWSVSALLALLYRRTIVALIPRDREVANQIRESRAAALLEIASEGSYEWHSVPHRTEHPLLEKLRASGEGGLIIFTSGSTATPKAALQSCERFLFKFRKPGRCLRTLAFMVLDHVGGLDTLFYTLSSGGTLVITRRRDPDYVLSLISSHKIEVLPTSSSFLRLCLARGQLTRDLSSLKVISYGSEPMDQSTLERLNEQFQGVQICQKYGTTEIGSPKTVSRANDSVWVKFKNDALETKVVDGVLWIRTEGTMLGYLNFPAEIDAQGWYCTGDLVDVDGEWIRFRGRVTDVINVGGEKVAPVEVEQVILELDFVQQVVVTGQPHGLLGQIVAARVTLAADVLDRKEAVKHIRMHCQKRLARYKVPMKVAVLDEIMLGDRQKLQRKTNPRA